MGSIEETPALDKEIVYQVDEVTIAKAGVRSSYSIMTSINLTFVQLWSFCSVERIAAPLSPMS